MPDGPEILGRLVFRPRHRLRHKREFDAVYAARVVAKQGPLTVFGLPNGVAEARLGLSVGRRVGNAVARNAAKRRVREAFRMVRAAFERDGNALDVVVAVSPHARLGGDGYRDLMVAAAARLWKQWDKRTGGRDGAPDGKGGGS
jgi:ribonuclease P protein component